MSAHLAIASPHHRYAKVRGAPSSITNEDTEFIVGIDTHADTHHVALITDCGKHVADKKFLALGSGYRRIAGYITQYGPISAVGIEGTGSYGAELACALATEGAHRRARPDQRGVDCGAEAVRAKYRARPEARAKNMAAARPDRGCRPSGRRDRSDAQADGPAAPLLQRRNRGDRRRAGPDYRRPRTGPDGDQRRWHGGGVPCARAAWHWGSPKCG